MPPLNFTDAYADNWDRIFGSADPARDEAAFFQRQLMTPFFRLDVILNYDIPALLEQANVPAAGTHHKDFLSLAKSKPAYLFEKLMLSGDSKKDRRCSELITAFQQRLDFFMRLKHGKQQRAAFGDVCDAVSKLLARLIDDNLPDGASDEFTPGILNGFLVATLRMRPLISEVEMDGLWKPFEEQIAALLNIHISPDVDIDWISKYVLFASELFGFLHIAHVCRPPFGYQYLERFLRIRERIGRFRWRHLDHDARFTFPIVALHCTVAFYKMGETLSPRLGVSEVSLRLLRHSMSDVCDSLRNRGESMYVPMMRYFIGKIDEGNTYRQRLYRTEIQNFTEADQFEIQRLVDRFHHYRHPVTEEGLVGFLSQFGTPKQMQLVLRVLREVKFLTLGDLQAMIEEAFLAFDDYKQCKVVAPLGSIGGSTALMTYLASHWSLQDMAFEPDIEHALANSAADTPLCLIDDGVFSGTQLVNIFGDLFGTRQRKSYQTKYSDPLRQPELFRDRPIRLCFALATDNALKRFEKDIREQFGLKDIEIRVSDIEVCQHRPFGASMSHIWDTIADRDEAKRMFADIGGAILRRRAAEKNRNWGQERINENSLGFGGDQRLVVYQYNVPKSTLTALWERGMYGDLEWKPLFPAND